jgi:hypothetical protein
LFAINRHIIYVAIYRSSLFIIIWFFLLFFSMVCGYNTNKAPLKYAGCVFSPNNKLLIVFLKSVTALFSGLKKKL